MKRVVVGCTPLAPSEYTTGHNKVAGYIHWAVCKHMRLQFTDRYYEHIPESVINVSGTTIMWDVPVITDRTILTNRPDTKFREDMPIERYGHTR
jgi:hypothetical protein